MYMSPYVTQPIGLGPYQQPEDITYAAFVQHLERSIQDEKTAANFYAALMEKVCNEHTTGVCPDFFHHIIADEQKHQARLSHLYRTVTGRLPMIEPQQVEEITSAHEGMQKALIDEYAAFHEYRSLYLTLYNPQLRNVFFELMTDELEHTTRLIYLTHLFIPPSSQ